MDLESEIYLELERDVVDVLSLKSSRESEDRPRRSHFDDLPGTDGKLRACHHDRGPDGGAVADSHLAVEEGGGRAVGRKCWTGSASPKLDTASTSTPSNFPEVCASGP